MTVDALPVFPLPHHVVLPHIVMPYRLFEKRYCELGAYLFEQQQACSDSEESAHDNKVQLLMPCLYTVDAVRTVDSAQDEVPDFYSCACLCELLHIEKSEQDEWNILIQAGERCQLTEVESAHAFRFAHVTSMPITADMSDAALQASLCNLAPEFSARMVYMGADAQQLKDFLSDCTQGEQLLHRMAHVMFSDPAFRQQYLEAPTLSAQLQYIRVSLGKSDIERDLNN